jgi:hypothetical protein
MNNFLRYIRKDQENYIQKYKGVKELYDSLKNKLE